MRNGDYPDGTHVVRAKIDMASPNINLRDPVLYRIKHEKHQETGDTWCIYPMYDFSHPIADALEGITHSLCTLEFEDHRPFYDWTVSKLLPTGLILDAKPVQIEFSRLNIQSTVLSKRQLIQLLQQGFVSGWTIRLPTLSGDSTRCACRLRLFVNGWNQQGGSNITPFWKSVFGKYGRYCSGLLRLETQLRFPIGIKATLRKTFKSIGLSWKKWARGRFHWTDCLY
jgi:hypothetical protein